MLTTIGTGRAAPDIEFPSCTRLRKAEVRASLLDHEHTDWSGHGNGPSGAEAGAGAEVDEDDLSAPGLRSP
jgi:hypothetical protein